MFASYIARIKAEPLNHALFIQAVQTLLSPSQKVAEMHITSALGPLSTLAEKYKDFDSLLADLQRLAKQIPALQKPLSDLVGAIKGAQHRYMLQTTRSPLPYELVTRSSRRRAASLSSVNSAEGDPLSPTRPLVFSYSTSAPADMSTSVRNSAALALAPPRAGRHKPPKG